MLCPVWDKVLYIPLCLPKPSIRCQGPGPGGIDLKWGPGGWWRRGVVAAARAAWSARVVSIPLAATLAERTTRSLFCCPASQGTSSSSSTSLLSPIHRVFHRRGTKTQARPPARERRRLAREPARMRASFGTSIPSSVRAHPAAAVHREPSLDCVHFLSGGFVD